MSLTEAELSVGKRVAYAPHRDAEPEFGTITGFNSTWVFVQYDHDGHSKATAAEHLKLADTF